MIVYRTKQYRLLADRVYKAIEDRGKTLSKFIPSKSISNRTLSNFRDEIFSKQRLVRDKEHSLITRPIERDGELLDRWVVDDFKHKGIKQYRDAVREAKKQSSTGKIGIRKNTEIRKIVMNNAKDELERYAKNVNREIKGKEEELGLRDMIDKYNKYEKQAGHKGEWEFKSQADWNPRLSIPF